MTTIPVRIRLEKLFCYHGDDESDSEPYLWVITVTIDGRTITHRPDAPSLDGAPGYVFSPGSHGSIGGSMGIGTTRTIPAAVGTINTTLQPILITAAGHQVEVPGQLALVAILLEEDMTSDEGAEAAHAKINEMIRVELNEAIADIDLDGVGAKIVRGLGQGRTPEEVAREYFAQRMTRVVNRLNRYAQDVAISAIVRALSFPAAIVEAADPDNFQGIVTRSWSSRNRSRHHQLGRRVLEAATRSSSPTPRAPHHPVGRRVRQGRRGAGRRGRQAPGHHQPRPHHPLRQAPHGHQLEVDRHRRQGVHPQEISPARS
jgi:hypothetical protein